MGLPDILQNDIVGLFGYDHAHLRLKYSGTGLGEWAVSARQTKSWEIAVAKMLFFSLPTFMLTGPVAAGEAGVTLTTEQWLLRGASGIAKSSAIGWLGGEILAPLGWKAGNDVIIGTNGADSLTVIVDRGIVHWTSGVYRWNWQNTP